ncbi:sigma factor regulatory protein, FecR/PupR family [Lysobacter enzymogenes]|uniref:Sigma factor regulatory protein, FecR/PupR family n=1 Tax=Lysobacter enzymogenes TaxID=69 RepID=A0A0S2DCA0_LYSEN|nr:FecR domain-containing protein [Lysobacter enzymogenes]ALN55976.1 sigma factor regulatory protein, FecR/PupR family [Lysobacter enzymogenes]
MTPSAHTDPTDPPYPGSDDPAGQARAWVARLASGEIDEAELAAFDAWRRVPAHRQAFARQRELWRALGTMRDAFESAPAPQAAAPRPAFAARPRRARSRLAAWGLASAACLAAVVAAAPILALNLRADYRTGIAAARYTLADGSTLALDADSAVAVDFDGRERRIELLRGNAWFRVAHGDARPFRVDALGGSVRDIGTAFEVSRHDAYVRAAVSEGLVEVDSGGAAPVSVAAGQAVSYPQGGAPTAPQPTATTDIAGWRQGELAFDAVRADEALRRIARYRSAPVWTLGSFERAPRISASLRADRSDEAIAAVAQRANLRVQRLPGGALLVRPPAD